MDMVDGFGVSRGNWFLLLPLKRANSTSYRMTMIMKMVALGLNISIFLGCIFGIGISLYFNKRIFVWVFCRLLISSRLPWQGFFPSRRLRRGYQSYRRQLLGIHHPLRWSRPRIQQLILVMTRTFLVLKWRLHSWRMAETRTFRFFWLLRRSIDLRRRAHPYPRWQWYLGVIYSPGGSFGYLWWFCSGLLQWR